MDALADKTLDLDALVTLLPSRSRDAIRMRRAQGNFKTSVKDKGAPKVVPQGASVQVTEGLEVAERVSQGNKMSMTINGVRDEVQDLTDLLTACRVDPTEWRVEKYRQKAYQGYIKNGDNEIEKVQLYSVTADMVRQVNACTLRDELEFLVNEARDKMPAVPPMLRVDRSGPSHLLVINPTDLHMGKYAWGKESGDNYTAEIAEGLLREAIEDLIAKSSPYKVGQVALVVGSDLLNADNSENTTTGGTPQTTDGRQQRTIRKTWQLMRDVVERLRHVAPVHIVVVNGNHDRDMSFIVGEILSVCFEGYADVTIDNSPPRRKYVEYGKCLIGFEHGDETKPRDLPGLMAQEAVEAWGRTQWRCFETGHRHDQAVMEFAGCIVRRNPALTAAEDWHAAKGFIGKIRTVHAHLWHPEDGNIAQFASTPITPAKAKVVNLPVAA